MVSMALHLMEILLSLQLMVSITSVCGETANKLKDRPVSPKKSVSWEEIESVTPTPGGDKVVEGSIPSRSDLTMISTDPDAIILDQHLHDRDIGDVMDAAHKGNYIGTRSRHKGPLLSMTDSSTFDFHANQTSVVEDKSKLRNSQPKGLLAASVKGGIHSSIYRSVTGVHQMLSNHQRFDAIGGKHAALRATIESDPRCAEAWLKEVNGLLESGNLVMMNIKEVPKGYKAIGYSGAFKHKYNPITKQYTSTRARFAPHGFRQIKGRDFDPDETAAPTLSMEAVHLYSMFMATKCPYKRARDVVSAFTSVELKELIIVEWPVGIPYVAGKCMRLGKMCYGLKQAAWVFDQKVKTVLLSLEFEPTLFDSCFYFQFIYEDGNKFLVIVCVYVDNFNIIAEREVDVIHFDKEISKALETWVEDPNVMLGIVFVETSNSLQLNMRFQVDAILERYKMLDCNVKRTPLPSGVLLGPVVEARQTAASQEFPYPELTGSLLWVIRCSFLNAKYACNQLCAHMSKWDETHVSAAIHLNRLLSILNRFEMMDCCSENNLSSIDCRCTFSVTLISLATQR